MTFKPFSRIGIRTGLALLAVIVLIILWTSDKPVSEAIRLNADQRSDADQAMKTDCWQQGGHGSGQAIAAFNARIPVLLASLMAKPEINTLPFSKIEAMFDLTGNYSMRLSLTSGDVDHILAELSPLYCDLGSHDQAPSMLFVVDHQGHYWQLDHGDLGAVQAVRWVDSLWIGTVDLFPLANGMGGGDQALWVIARQGTAWAVVNKWPSYVLGSDTYQLDNGIQHLTMTSTRTMTQLGDAPCPAVARMPGYTSTITFSMSSYVWETDHYTLTESSPFKPVTVYFETVQGVLPTPQGIEMTSYYDPAHGLQAYSTDQWEILCNSRSPEPHPLTPSP